MSEYVIEMLGITKSFPGIKANDNITLRLKKGEIHALLGENGAGKSTLVSVLFGLYKPDGGTILKNGVRVSIRSPNEATSLGIGMVQQHFRPVEAFTVLENIILGAEDSRFGFLIKNKAREKVLALCERYRMKIDPDARAEDLTVSMQQKTEILKMLYRNNDILIFDEPTSALTPQETAELMSTLKSLRDEGKSVLFITHKLDEIMQISDRVTVLRKGRRVATVNTRDTDKKQLSAMMVGRDVELKVKKAPARPTDTVLEVKGLYVASLLHKKRLAVNGVSFTVKKGEILAIAGVDGNGQTELTGALTGLVKAKKGSIHICGKDVTNMPVALRNKEFLSHIPENREKHGLVLDFRLMDNLILKRYHGKEFQRSGFMRRKSIRAYAERLIKTFDIRTEEDADTVTRNISGGNQQKAVVARELDYGAPLVIAVQPARGLDIGATERIHNELIKKRDEGCAVLLVSLELDEVMNISDRILTLHEGKITGEFYPEKTTLKQLSLAMTGGKNNE